MGEKQVIISLNREYGSGGHIIARKLASYFELPIIDYMAMKELAEEHHMDKDFLERYDEVPIRPGLNRSARGYNSSPAVNLANMQFDLIRKRAAEGGSFVVVGRCSEEILKGNPGLITIFLLADMDQKIELVSQRENITATEAKDLILRENRRRKSYHNYYCKGKWGDSRNYELSLNSSRLGLDGTAAFLETYIEKRMAQIRNS